MDRCVLQAVDTVGEILLSLSYLPTAERLTVVVVKAKNLVWSSGKVTAGERGPQGSLVLLHTQVGTRPASSSRHVYWGGSHWGQSPGKVLLRWLPLCAARRGTRD